ncbi:MAG: hypothetical protein KGN34_09230 [Sphingomonadales bacterium]|nr:hypothetical protein [Sphingomonadales bacterium]
MSFNQLASPLPVYVVDKGKGLCFAVIDYGPEHNLIWVTALDDSGEIWCAPNPMVRMQSNWTLGRGRSAPEQAARESALPTPAFGPRPVAGTA